MLSEKFLRLKIGAICLVEKWFTDIEIKKLYTLNKTSSDYASLGI